MGETTGHNALAQVLRLLAAICPLLLAAAYALVLWARYDDRWDAWGLANGLVLLYVGVPLVYAAVPVGAIGLGCAIALRRQEQRTRVLTLLLIALNSFAIAAGTVHLVRFERDKAIRQAYFEQNVRYNAAHYNAVEFAEQHGGRFPDNVIELLNIEYLPEKIDLPNWGTTDSIQSMHRMPAEDQQVILDWLRDNHDLIYLGRGLTLDALDLPTADRIVLFIERDHVPEHGYQVTMLDGGSQFVDRAGVQAALSQSNDARAEAGLPTHGEAEIIHRLR